MSTTVKPELTATQKNKIAQTLLANSVATKVNHGMIKQVAEQYGVARCTIHRVWAEAKAQIQQGIPIQLTSNKKGITKKRRQTEIDLERMKSVPFAKRCSIRSLAVELKLSRSHIGRWVKSGVIKPHTNAIKPELTEKNRLQRLNYSLNALQVDVQSRKIKFAEMYHEVHIDEKWFYMSRNSERYYLVPGETPPHRTCKSKRFIPKVMFMCAVSRPRKATADQVEFDGKIGIWPFIKIEPAQRKSKNREKGTLVTKPIDSITKEVTKSCLINQIIPAIKAKWPPNASKNIIIQQDNAPPHISNDDPDFRAAASSDGFNIQLMFQPPNSPDTNILDLGFFRAVQSLQVETSSYTVDDIVKNVLLSFEGLTAETLNKVFLSLQNCLVEIMKVQGKNNYKLPHMDKDKLIRQGMLPTSLEVDEELVRASIDNLLETQQREALCYDIQPLLAELGY